MTFLSNWPELSMVRSMANLLADEARLSIHDQNSAKVIANISDVHALSKSMRGRPAIVGALVGIGIDSLAADVAQELIPNLNCDGPNGAKREDVERLITMFLDDGDVVSNIRRGLRTERVLIHEAIAAIANPPAAGTPNLAGGGNLNGFARYAFRPVIYSNHVSILDIFDETLKLMDLPSHKAFIDASGTLKQKRAEIESSNLRLLAGIYAPSTERYVETSYRVRADRHLAATALAIRLYALDNNGALPTNLGLLVPKYLPGVPDDAMDGAALRYDPARAILWSIGSNGKDDGGDEIMLRSYASYSKWSALDVVVHLTPFKRPAPPATEPVETSVEVAPATTQP